MVFSLVEVVGSVTALAYLLLIAKRLAIAWLFYIVSSVLYMLVFWQERLYADSLLQMFFVCLGLHAWKRWSVTSVNKVMLTSEGVSKHLVAVVGIAAMTGMVGGALYLYTDAGMFAFPDALILVGSVYATVLTVRGVIENWWYWVVINSVTVGLYYQKGLSMTVGLAALYTVISCYGLVQWRRAGQV